MNDTEQTPETAPETTPETAPETQEQTPETPPETPPETETKTKTKAKQNKGNRIMTPERIENLKIARAKAALLRKQLREASVVEKPPTKLEVRLEKIKLNKNKNEAPAVDIPMVSKMEVPKCEETATKVEEHPTPPTPVERVVKQEEEPPIVIKKPLYRREGQFLFM